MASYCSGKKNATVFLDNRERIISESVPITVECNQGNLQRVTTNTGRVVYCINPRMGSLSRCIALNYQNTLLTDCSDGTDDNNWCFDNNEYITSIASAEASNSPKCGVGDQLVIKDKNNNTIYTHQGCLEFKVSCDDECPPDHIRCQITAYPGYCCIPCSTVAARVNALAARL